MRRFSLVPFTPGQFGALIAIAAQPNILYNKRLIPTGFNIFRDINEANKENMMPFVKLFEMGKIGNLQLKNRIIYPPMVTRYVNADGSISQQLIDYYAERARGGCGLIIIEAAYPRSGGYPGRIYLNEDRIISGLRRLAEAIHAAGAKAAMQINPHRGQADEVDPASATEVIHRKTGIKARALSVNDIRNLEEAVGEGARRVKEAGFDCVMLHGGHGYLVAEFLSPRINKRNDEYGGDVKNRARFALELVAAVKRKTGADFPLMFRLAADERVAGGFGISEAVTVCKLLEEAGVDSIDIVSGSADTYVWTFPYMYMPRGCNTPLSQAIKKVMKIPVSVAGRINDPDIAEEILREQKADFVDMGRALIADPQFPNKVREGRVKEICRCIACGRCAESILKSPVGPMICSVNPAVGKEKEFESGLKSAARKKKVLVIGGGPGGMEAAAIASQRGHQVTLWEKDNKLGGQLNLATAPPGKDEVKGLLEYLTYRLNQLRIPVQLRKEVTPAAVSEFSPDAVIVAAGSKPLIPKIKGMEQRKVISFREVLSGMAKIGKSVVVIGGGFVGCETADFLAQKGKKVTIVEILPVLAGELYYPYADLLISELRQRGVETFTSVKKEEITPKGMEIVDQSGKRIFLEADDIVIAAGSVADKTLFESLKGKVPELYAVGDCVQARRIFEAVSDGASVAMKI